MTYGPIQVFTAGIASGASTSSAIDKGTKTFRNMALNAVTMSTGAAITVLGSNDDSTYYVVHERVNTAPVQYQSLTVATTTSGGWAVTAAPPFRYLKFITSAVVSGGVSITVNFDD